MKNEKCFEEFKNELKIGDIFNFASTYHFIAKFIVLDFHSYEDFIATKSFFLKSDSGIFPSFTIKELFIHINQISNFKKIKE